MTALSENQKAFVSANLPLAKHVASLHMRRFTRDDYHDAVIGMCIAAIHFDASRGTKFSSMAVPTIRGTMNLLWRKAQLIYVPVDASKARREIIRNHAWRARHVWLVPKLDDVPIDHDWPDLDAGFDLARLLKTLPEREQLVVVLRWIEEKTLAEIAKRLKVTRERVRQIEMKAMNKLRMTAKEWKLEVPCPAGSAHEKPIQLV